MLQIKTRSQLEGHDVYELACAHAYPAQHWSEDSLYLTDDEQGIVPLLPYLSTVLPAFDPYGPQRVSSTQWQLVYDAYWADPNRDLTLEAFFSLFRQWLHRHNQDADYFWILGI